MIDDGDGEISVEELLGFSYDSWGSNCPTAGSTREYLRCHKRCS